MYNKARYKIGQRLTSKGENSLQQPIQSINHPGMSVWTLPPEPSV